MEFTTKQKGNITELQCLLYFQQLGYEVSIPWGENCRYDMIVDVEGYLLKIQCKTCRDEKPGETITFSVASTHKNRARVEREPYTEKDIDFFATFYENHCYLIPIQETGSGQKVLRLVPPQNNQKNVNMLNDYLCEVQLQEFINNDFSIKKNTNKSIVQYDLDGVKIATFSSCREAAEKALGDINKNAHICAVCNGKRKTAYGYKWAYI